MRKCDDGPGAHKRLASPEVDTGALREAIFTRTTQVIRRRCWVRRAVIGSALAVCYVAGMGTMQAWEHVDNAAASQPLAANSSDADAVATKAAPIKKTVKLKKIAPKRTRPKRSRFEVLCRITDRYLDRDADVVAAIRGYRRALRVATPEELKICPQRDSWVLMALKQELIRKENRDENRGA